MRIPSLAWLIPAVLLNGCTLDSSVRLYAKKHDGTVYQHKGSLSDYAAQGFAHDVFDPNASNDSLKLKQLCQSNFDTLHLSITDYPAGGALPSTTTFNYSPKNRHLTVVNDGLMADSTTLFCSQ